MTGILAIPISILGLVYAYLLYQKTRWEARCLELEIEKERQPGLPGISESKTERTRCENDRARSRSNRSRRWATLIALRTNAGLTKPDLLMDFSPGNEDKIWTAESIAFVKRGLFILYAISILLVSTFVASAVRLLGFVWLEKTSKIGLARGTPD